jgi:hypothetical protein
MRRGESFNIIHRVYVGHVLINYIYIGLKADISNDYKGNTIVNDGKSEKTTRSGELVLKNPKIGVRRRKKWSQDFDVGDSQERCELENRLTNLETQMI